MKKSYSINVKHNGEYWKIGIHEEPVTMDSRHFSIDGYDLKNLLSTAADVITETPTKDILTPAAQ